MTNLELRVPPVALVFLFGALMWGLALALPGMRYEVPGRVPISMALLFGGAAISAAGVAAFRRARTTVNPMTPGASSTLVAVGVYKLTRNPMYVGFALALAAWAVFLQSPVTLAGVVGFVGYMTRFQIHPEERALEATFGQSLRDYKERVRRWI